MSRALRPLVRSALVAIALAGGSRALAADAPGAFSGPVRVAHVADALTALARATPAALEEGTDYARVLDRGACSAGAERLRAECLRIAVDKYCQDRDDSPQCRLYMDVVLSSVLADPRLLPPDKRYAIIRANTDYRAAIARELRRMQGVLAVDFRLHEGDANGTPAIATKIDHFCLGTDRPAAFSYPACVSSLVWFIAGPK